MNGAETGMAAMIVMPRLIRQVLTVGLTGFFVAVAGTTSRGTVACRIATPTRRAIAATTSAFASPSRSNNLKKCSKLRNESNKKQCGIGVRNDVDGTKNDSI